MRPPLRNAFKILTAILFISLLSWHGAFSETVNPGDDLKKEMFNQTKPLIDAKKYDDVVAYANSMVSKYPDKPQPYYFLGLGYYGKDDLDTAEKNLKLSVDLDPSMAESYYYLALIEYKRGDLKQVIDYLNEVTAIDGNFQIAYYNKGVAFLAIKMPKRAIKEFAYAMYLEPMDTQSLAGLLKAAEELKLVEVDKSDVPEDILKKGKELPAIAKSPEAMLELSKPSADERSIAEQIVSPLSKGKQELAETEPLLLDAHVLGGAVPEPEKASILSNSEPEKPKGAFVAQVSKAPVYSYKLFLSSSLSKEEIRPAKDAETEIKSINKLKGALEISFNTPSDLSVNAINIELKGLDGGEKVRVIIRDSATKRSPAFEIKNITNDWKAFNVSVKEAGIGIDLTRVENIKFELLPSTDTAKADATVSARNLAIE